MTKNQLKRYRNQRWPQSQWEDGEKWPENGSLKSNTISDLMLCCRGTEKWDEMPSVDMFFSLRRDWDIRKKGGLVDSKRRIGIYVLKEKKGKPRCIEWENSEEDIQLLVAPPKQPKSDSSSGDGVVSAISKRTQPNFYQRQCTESNSKVAIHSNSYGNSR